MTATYDTLEIRPCPCGDPICKKVVLWPLQTKIEASMDRVDAELLVRRYNSQPLLLETVQAYMSCRERSRGDFTKIDRLARAAIAEVEKEP